MINDKRKALRRSVRYTAWIVREGEALHGCALFDISETGARIDVEDSDAVPEQFVLLLSGNGKARRRCRVVWRQPNQIGVKFETRLAADDRARLVVKFDEAPLAPAQDEDTGEAAAVKTAEA
jgi:hypothetical protein